MPEIITAQLNGPSIAYPAFDDPGYYYFNGVPVIGDLADPPANQGLVGGTIFVDRASVNFTVSVETDGVRQVDGLAKLVDQNTVVIEATDSSLLLDAQAAYYPVFYRRFSNPWLTFELSSAFSNLYRVE